MQNNKGKKRTERDIQKMKKLVEGNTPTGLITYKLGRTDDGIKAKAHDLGLSLKPVNKSPYNRRKK